MIITLIMGILTLIFGRKIITEIKKQKGKIAVAVIIALLTGLVGFFWARMNHWAERYDQAQSIIFKKDSTYRTKDSAWVTISTQQQMDIKTFKELYGKEASKNKAMGVKLKNLETSISFNYKSAGKAVADTFWTFAYKDSLSYDTIKVENEKFNDGFLSYTRMKVGDANSIVSYTYSDSVYVSTEKYHEVKRWPKFLPKLRAALGAKNDTKVLVSLSNKNAKVSNIKYIKIIK